MKIITFPSGLDSSECAERMRKKGWRYARPAIRQIAGVSYHVVLLLGETALSRENLEITPP